MKKIVAKYSNDSTDTYRESSDWIHPFLDEAEKFLKTTSQRMERNKSTHIIAKRPLFVNLVASLSPRKKNHWYNAMSYHHQFI